MKRIDLNGLTLLVVALGPILLFARLLLLREVLYWGTPMLQFVPWHRLAIESVSMGELPLWTSQLGMGAPLLANLQSALLYPLNLLLFIIGPEHGHGYLVVLHLILSGLGMVFLARQLGFDYFGQLVAALSFSLSGYLVARAWFISINHAVAWLPWIILFTERLLDRRKTRPMLTDSLAPILGLTLSLSLQWLAGHAQTSWYTLVMLVIWIVWRLRQEKDPALIKWTLTRVGFVGILAFLVAAAQLLPAIEYLSLSQRATSIDREFALTYSFWPWRSLGLIFPNLFGNPAAGDYWGYGNYWEDAVYIGILPFLFSIGAIWRGLGRSEKDFALERFLMIVCIIAFLLALGKNTPLYPFLFDYVPTFDLFQAPTRWNILLIFSLSILAGRGAEAWATPHGRGLYWTRLLTAGAGIIAFASYIGLQLIPELNPTFIRSFVESGIFLTGSGLLTLFLPKNRKFLKVGLVGVFLLCDLLSAHWGLNPTIEPSVFEGNVLKARGISPNTRIYMPTELEYQLKFEQTHRFERFDPGIDWRMIRELAIPNTSTLDGVASITNFDPLLTARYLSFIAALESMSLIDQNELLSWIGVSHRIDWDPDHDAQIVFLPLATRGRIHLVGDPVVVAGGDQALELLQSGEINLETQVILEAPADLAIGEGAHGEILEFSESGSNQVSIHVQMKGDGWLVLADTWYPGWKASVDENRVDIYRANYLFRAVAVPDGEHVIRFEYQPTSFWLGAILSIVGILSIGLMGYRCYRRD